MENKIKFINLLNLSRKKIGYKQNFIDKLIYENNSGNDSIESINKLRILILIHIFHFENYQKYLCIKRPLLFLQSVDTSQNNIYNSYENILWAIKQNNLGKIYIPLLDLYRLFNFVEARYISYLENKKIKSELDLFFIGGYPSYLEN